MDSLCIYPTVFTEQMSMTFFFVFFCFVFAYLLFFVLFRSVETTSLSCETGFYDYRGN